MTFLDYLKELNGNLRRDYQSRKAPRRLLEDGLREMLGPIARSLSGNVFNSVKTGLSRDGLLFRGSELNQYIARFAFACSTEGAFMNVTEELQQQYDAAAELWKGYKERLTEFRSVVKNDVASIEASARKTTEAVRRMSAAYGDVITQLNSDEMLKAIENAERLSHALGSLAALQSHRLVFSVGENAPQKNGATGA